MDGRLSQLYYQDYRNTIDKTNIYANLRLMACGNIMKGEVMKSKRLFTLLFAIVALITLGSIRALATPQEGIEVSFIVVGQGDSELISDASGLDVLIDGRESSTGQTFASYIHEQNVDDIDVLVASHADSDHIGGLIDVFEEVDLPVEQVRFYRYAGDMQTWTDFVYAVNNGELIARGTPTATDILNVSHQGSRYAPSDYLLSDVQLAEAVITADGNPYDQTAIETTERLIASSTGIWRTGEQGTIVVTSDGETYSVYAAFVYSTHLVFMPIILNETLEVTPQMTPTPTQTATPTATTTQQPSPSGDVKITTIFYIGEGIGEPDEYVEIRNDDTNAIQLAGWTLRDIADHVFTFPSFVMQPGQICRVYTNEYHPELCGFNYGSRSEIWNNGGDCAYLQDNQNELVSVLCY